MKCFVPVQEAVHGVEELSRADKFMSLPEWMHKRMKGHEDDEAQVFGRGTLKRVLDLGSRPATHMPFQQLREEEWRLCAELEKGGRKTTCRTG